MENLFVETYTESCRNQVLHLRNMTSLRLHSLSYSQPFKMIDGLLEMDQSGLERIALELEEPSNIEVLTQMMFFQKYFNRFCPLFGEMLERVAISNHQRYKSQTDSNSPPYSISRFNSDEQNLITMHLAYIQGTQGCGGDCIRSCGVDAVPGVRDRTPVDHILWTLERVSKHKDRKQFLKLFYASDPSELALDSENFFHISRTYYRLFKRPLEVVTSIPKGSEELYKEMLRKKDPSIRMCVSITEENVQRLYRNGILTADSIENLPLIPGNNLRIPPGVFIDGYVPKNVNLVNEESREKVGINGYQSPGLKFGFWNRTALIMTPYGILNTLSIPRVDREYPQGRIVASVGRISDKPFNISVGDQVDMHLTDCVVRYSDLDHTDNRLFCLSNLLYNQSVMIDRDGKVTHSYETFDPGFKNPTKF